MAETITTTNGTPWLQGLQLELFQGAGFSGHREGNFAEHFKAGLALAGFGRSSVGRDGSHKLMTFPINGRADRVTRTLWSYGGDAAVRLDLFDFNVDLGVHGAMLSGEGQDALGLGVFGRIGVRADIVGIEGGTLVYSGHEGVDAGRAYVGFYLNFGAALPFARTWPKRGRN